MQPDENTNNNNNSGVNMMGDTDNTDAGSVKCDCYERERYLTRCSGDQKANFVGQTLDEANGIPADQDILQVLITRPEIASRPRDNIIFEGDMDLKTTFETSYEALAKMRLDHFKKHQKQMKEGSKKQVEIEADRLTEKLADKPMKQKRSLPKQKRQKEEVEEEEEEEEKKVEIVNGEHDNNFVTTTITTKQMTTINKLDKSNSLSHSCDITDNKQNLNGNLSSMKKQSDLAKLVNGGGIKAQKLEQTHTMNDIKRYSNNESPIDPDLSPLIVYNANMNRLDTVGLRRRSKYRPSTTLKAGRRGLFGDCDELQEELPRNKSPHPVQPNKGPEMVSSKANGENLNKSQRALNVRNLRDSKQANYLVYSDFNIPVDSKRKIQDNINMRDHIKEQNIVESSSDGFLNDEIRETTPQNEDDSIVQNDLNLLNLNEEEEEERVAFSEIKRVIQSPIAEVVEHSKSINQSRNSSNCAKEINDIRANSNVSRISNRTYVDDGGRQSKLQRTCQNQNFDIFQGEYLEEPKSKQGNNSSTIKLLDNPQSLYLQHNNSLFRESPDFILATRGYSMTNYYPIEDNNNNFSRQEETGSAQNQSKSVDDNNQFEDTTCKVLSLDDNFRYVGSLAGHNYFVEK